MSNSVKQSKLCEINHITVKQAKTLLNSFCGFENHKMPKFRAALSNSVKQTLQNNMQLCETIVCEKTVTLRNGPGAVCEPTSNSAKQTCKKTVKQSDTLSTV